MTTKVKDTALTVLESKLTNPESVDLYNKKINLAITGLKDCRINPAAKKIFLDKVIEVKDKALKMKIVDDDSRIEVSDLLAVANNLLKLLKDKKTDPLKKIDDEIKTIKADYKEIESKVKEVVEILKKEIQREFDEAERKKRDEQRKADEKIRIENEKAQAKIREEEEKAAKELKSKNDLIREQAKQKLADTIEKIQAKSDEKTESIQAKADEKAPVVKSVSTTTGNTVVKKVWDYDLINIDEVPTQYVKKELIASAVRKAVNDGVREIAGIKIYQKTVVAS